MRFDRVNGSMARCLGLAAAAAGMIFVAAPVQAQIGSLAKATGLPPAFQLASPDVRPDGHVIFRLYAPNAKEVRLSAEGKESTPGMTSDGLQKGLAGFPMTRGADGIWSITFGPIQPGLYRYTFLVDSVTTADPSNLQHTEKSSFVASMYEVPGSFHAYRPGIPHGAVAAVWYDSPLTGGLRRMHVYTPPGYEAGKGVYPVLYLLGGGNTDDGWATFGRAGAILDNLIAEGKARPMIVVMPTAYAAHGMASQTSERTDRDLSNADLTDQVVPYIDAHYRAHADRRHRAVAGLSFGGLQALHAAFLHGDLFASAGIFGSGWYTALQAEQNRSLAAYARLGKPFDVFFMGAARLDVAVGNSRDTADVLTAHGIKVDRYMGEGFHGFPSFRDDLLHFVPLLFR